MGAIRTKNQIRVEAMKVLKHNEHSTQNGILSLFVGLILWFILIGAFIIGCSKLYAGYVGDYTLYYSIAASLLMMFADNENVRRNTLATAENRLSNKSAYILRTGIHWTRFGFLRVVGTYNSTPNQRTLKLIKTPTVNGLFINLIVKVTLVLVDGFAAEDQGVDDVLSNMNTELIDASQAFVKTQSLTQLDTLDRENARKFVDDREQLRNLLRDSGYVLTKIDFIDVVPSASIIAAKEDIEEEKLKSLVKTIKIEQNLYQRNLIYFDNLLSVFKEKGSGTTTKQKIKSDAFEKVEFTKDEVSGNGDAAVENRKELLEVMIDILENKTYTPKPDFAAMKIAAEVTRQINFGETKSFKGLTGVNPLVKVE